MLEPNPYYDGIRRWSLWEVIRSWAFSGISVLTKETPESSLTFSTLWGHHKKAAIYEPGSWFSPDTKFASTLILDFPAYRTVGNKFLLLISYTVYGVFVRAAQTKKDSKFHRGRDYIHFVHLYPKCLDSVWLLGSAQSIQAEEIDPWASLPKSSANPVLWSSSNCLSFNWSFLTTLSTCDVRPFVGLQYVISFKALCSCDEQLLRTHNAPGPALGSEETMGRTRASQLSTECRVSGKMAE